MSEVTYYEINEQAAKRAKEQNSFSDYEMGSATKEYQQSVDRAVALAQEQKEKVDHCFHEKIDRLVDVYAKKKGLCLDDREKAGGEHEQSILYRCPCAIVYACRRLEFSCKAERKTECCQRQKHGRVAGGTRSAG